MRGKQKSVLVPAREARALHVSRGDRFRIIDVEGGQVADLFAFSADDPLEYASAEHTRVHVNRVFPEVGEGFVTNRRRPILFFEEDHSPGRHDMLCAACDPERYRLLGVETWHASCQANLEQAMREMGHTRVEIPQPINLFMNVGIERDGTLAWGPTRTKPGDYVLFIAEQDCILVVSACPQDLNEINQYKPSPVAVERLD